MPPPDLQRISRGLAVAHWGFRLIAGAVVTAAALFATACLLDRLGGLNSDRLFIPCVILIITLSPVTIAIGILVGSIGRVLCLRTPQELPVARARIRLAVTLEGCGLMTALVNGPFVFMLAWGTRGIFEPHPAVTGSVLVFSFVLFIAGRVFFLTYTVALEKVVDMKLVTRPSVAAIMVILAGSTLFAAGWALFRNSTMPITYSHLLPAGIAFVVAVCVFGTLYLYGRHLRRLREAVKRFNTPSAKEVALVLVQRPR